VGKPTAVRPPSGSGPSTRIDPRDLAIASGLGILAFAVYRATEQVLLFHDSVFFREMLAEGKWRHFHVLWLPTLQVFRLACGFLGTPVSPRDAMFVVSALSGSAIAAAAYVLCRSLASRRVSAGFALLVLVSPAVWFQSASACLHAFHGAFATTALALAQRLRPGAGPFRRLAAGCAIGLVPLSHASGIYLVPGLLAFALARGGRLRRRPWRRLLALLLPVLLSLLILAWFAAPGRLGPDDLPSGWLTKGLPTALADPGTYLRSGLRQIAASMPLLLAGALLGWAVVLRRRRGFVLRSLLIVVPLCFGASLWVQDLVGAYYLGLLGVFCLSAVHGLRRLRRSAGTAAVGALLAAAIVVQATLSAPNRIREADPGPLRERTEALLQTGALLLYEPHAPLAAYFLEAAHGRTVFNLYLVDGIPPETVEGGLEELRRATEGLVAREVILDRRVYRVVERGSRLTPWFEGFRAGFLAEPLPGHPDFEILRPLGGEVPGSAPPASRPR